MAERWLRIDCCACCAWIAALSAACFFVASLLIEFPRVRLRFDFLLGRVPPSVSLTGGTGCAPYSAVAGANRDLAAGVGRRNLPPNAARFLPKAGIALRHRVAARTTAATVVCEYVAVNGSSSGPLFQARQVGHHCRLVKWATPMTFV